MSAASPVSRAGAAGVWDAIVIGSGVGGLVCAGYLAASGRRTLVLEAHDVAGGCAQVFRRRGLYEFDVGAHYLGDFGPRGRCRAIVNGLGLAGRVEFSPSDPDGFDVVSAPGFTFRVPAGWDRYRARLKETFAGEAEGIDLVVDALSAAGRQLRARAPRGPSTRWERGELAALLSAAGLSSQARTALAAQSLNLGMPLSRLAVSAYGAMLDSYMEGAHRIVGGGQHLVASLVEVIEAHGGEVRTKARAERVTLERGRATGVLLSSGERLSAPVVVSNADQHRTMLELVGPEALPERLRSRLARTTYARPTASLFLAVDREFERPRDHNVWYFLDDDIDACHADPSGARFALISPASGLAPEGHQAFQVLTLLPEADPAAYGRGYRKEGTYTAGKHELTERLLDLAEDVLGPFREHLTHVELSTALTHTRYTGATGGTAYGPAATTRQVGAWRPSYATHVDGLYLVGASTRTGGGFPGVTIGAVLCASEILGRPLLEDVMAGAVVADADLLPERSDDWDPLRVSRGRVRADRSVPPLRLARPLAAV
ncbi:phytoene desaturase family protein [Streptomyces sp. NPDC056528]|uniref:phytoene desaturase family protein n=1 Tax=Streptomyces sp. NPDC056528 TaxID=3345854 RepID=UPI0036A51C54